jgi:FMN phosphatase YigB (HAD superfamily)
VRDAVIFDVDGTLADVSGIRHYLTDDAKRKNFEKFHGAASYVRPHQPIIALAQSLTVAGFPILVVTGRMEKWRYPTSIWLRKWGVEFTELHHRRDGDPRRDVEVKRDILADLRARYRIILAVDDNPAIIALWNEECIPTVTWPGWDVD